MLPDSGTYSSLLLASTFPKFFTQLLQGETAVFPRKLFPRHGERDQLSAAGCRESYNYKYPHPCKPGVNCAFIVKWQTCREGWVEYDVKARLVPGLNHTSSLWVALGFSSSSDMVRAMLVYKPHLKNHTSSLWVTLGFSSSSDMVRVM